MNEALERKGRRKKTEQMNSACLRAEEGRIKENKIKRKRKSYDYRRGEGKEIMEEKQG